MTTVSWCEPQPNREFQMLKWWSAEQIMGTYALPINWHFTWLLHDMQSAMLVHDAFKAPEQVHYTSSQCEQDLLQDQLQRQETNAAVPVKPERPLVPVVKSQIPELSNAAEVQLEALPQR